MVITKAKLMKIITEEIALRLMDEAFPQLFQHGSEEEFPREPTHVDVSIDEVPFDLGDDEGEFEPVELPALPRWAMQKAYKLMADFPEIPISPTTVLDFARQFVALEKAEGERPEATTPLEKPAAKMKEGYDPAGVPRISPEDLETIRDYTKTLPYGDVEKIAIHFMTNYDLSADEAVRLLQQMVEMEQEQEADPAVARYIKEELEAYLAEKKKYKKSFYKAKEKKADELMASGTDEDAAYGIADTIVSKQGKKKKKSKRKKK